MDATELLELNGVVGLTGGILDDAQQLVQQQIALAKAELREELASFKARAWSLGIGLGIFFLGCIPVPFFLTEALLSLSDRQLPMWAAYLIVSLALLTVGALSVRAARNAPTVLAPTNGSTATV